MSDALKPLIAAAADRPLSRAEATQAFEILFAGDATPAQMGGLLMALRTRGETVDEYAAAASVMRAHCHRVRAPAGAIDIVGTGIGDHCRVTQCGILACEAADELDRDSNAFVRVV